MSNYICKECDHNRNGWCVLHKKQGLKNIMKCDDLLNSKKQILVKEEPKKEDKESKDMLLEIGRVKGKRELLYFLQRECIAGKTGTLTMETLDTFSMMIENEEKIWKVDNYESEIDRNLREHSKQIAKIKK